MLKKRRKWTANNFNSNSTVEESSWLVNSIVQELFAYFCMLFGQSSNHRII